MSFYVMIFFFFCNFQFGFLHWKKTRKLNQLFFFLEAINFTKRRICWNMFFINFIDMSPRLILRYIKITLYIIFIWKKKPEKLRELNLDWNRSQLISINRLDTYRYGWSSYSCISCLVHLFLTNDLVLL